MGLTYCDRIWANFSDQIQIFGAQEEGMDLQHELEVAKRLALEAGERLREFHQEQLEMGHLRTSHEVVTVPDLVADDMIVSGLREVFPHDAICSEQSPTCWDRFQCDRLWLIDALDGVESLAEHGDEYTVSIGLAIRGQAVLGVVYNPMRDELYAGTISGPVTLNDEPVELLPQRQRHEPRITVQRSDWHFIYGCVPELLALNHTASISYDLARIAAGTHDGFFSLLPLREWSTCAGVALICAAERIAMLQGSMEVTYNSEVLRHSAGLIASRTGQQKNFIEYIVGLPEMEEITNELRRRNSAA